MPNIRQLVVIDYTPYSDATHMLVRSTAPVNAEEGSLQLPLQGKGETLTDHTDEALKQLRHSLSTFLAGFRASHQGHPAFEFSSQCFPGYQKQADTRSSQAGEQ